MLKDLFDDGLSISEIARQNGHDRKTIRKYINSETLPLRKDGSSLFPMGERNDS